MNIVAFSGGKDSTALVLRMAELGEEFVCLFTPTGNELPPVREHIDNIIAQTGKHLVLPQVPRTLEERIHHYNALPSWRMRWCTREIKIQPCIDYLVGLQKESGDLPTLCVGLRADEEERQGMYGSYATYRYPLREWGWGIKEVFGYLREKGVEVPKRTDCALCYDQRLSEWYELWRTYPDEYAKGESLEAQTGHTFRSSQRDTWPASLTEMRLKFEAGYRPRGVDDQLAMDFAPETARCRVCRL